MSVQSGELFLLFLGVFSAKTSETEWEGTESVVYEVHNSQGGTNWMALSSLKDGEPDLKLGGGPEVQSSWLNSTLRRLVGMYGPHRGSQHGQVVFFFLGDSTLSESSVIWHGVPDPELFTPSQG